ncbi:hypothetical protein SAMN05443377_104134 [Propionibacterium cyclohexanicum]|uniref:Uncharacterized protein n=1 Tax=Propionibacterium cyclohexanicum TaxID=64702 RepID=A0A1H9QUM7_9ACTN|nr:hypothetical protein SAMN05443377_104134 [Propionibacterium cyclohexanicum]
MKPRVLTLLKYLRPGDIVLDAHRQLHEGSPGHVPGTHAASPGFRSRSSAGGAGGSAAELPRSDRAPRWVSVNGAGTSAEPLVSP